MLLTDLSGVTFAVVAGLTVIFVVGLRCARQEDIPRILAILVLMIRRFWR